MSVRRWRPRCDGRDDCIYRSPCPRFAASSFPIIQVLLAEITLGLVHLPQFICRFLYAPSERRGFWNVSVAVREHRLDNWLSGGCARRVEIFTSISSPYTALGIWPYKIHFRVGRINGLLQWRKFPYVSMASSRSL